MPTYVRVKDKSTGHHWTVTAQEAEVNADAYVVLKQDAVDHNGDPLPGEIPDATTDQSPRRAAKKTTAKKTAAKKAEAQKPAEPPTGQQADTSKEK